MGSATLVAAPFLGAMLLEVTYWYQIRDKLTLEKYKVMMRSAGFWIVTALAVLGGGAGALIYSDGRLNAGQMLIAGAAFPTLFKKLIATAVATNGTAKLGRPAARFKATDYFVAA